MGKIKGWDKLNDYQWSSDIHLINLYKSSDGIYDAWMVKKKDGAVIWHEDFDTKQLANDFVIDYMRRNP